MTRSRVANDTQTAVRMPSELYERLQKAAGDRPVGEEIRRRLDASFAGTPSVADEKTAELVGAIDRTADTLRYDFAPWHEDRFAFEAMQRTIAKVLRFYQPPGEPVLEFNPTGAGNLIYPDDGSPEDIANALAAMALDRIREARAKP
jgi:hypothetical protein